mmetsp:Transcript_73998/g.214351  ORF Transcript_73998/g.214351 Transcript_73998/m.214351 type:complete len:644 (-) Transcript_73998:445-2376(-)
MTARAEARTRASTQPLAPTRSQLRAALLLGAEHRIHKRHARGHLGFHAGVQCLHALDQQRRGLEVVHGQQGLVCRDLLLRLRVVHLEPLQQLRQAHVVLCIEHRAALRRRKAIAVEVHDVDVGRPLGKALAEDAEAFVDHREEQALLHLLVRDRSGRDALRLSDDIHLRDHLRVRLLVPALVDEDPAPVSADALVRRLQAEAVALAEPIREVVRAHVRLRLLLHVPGSLPLLPEELLTHQVAQAHRPHGHAEVLRDPLQLLHGSPLLKQGARLRGIGRDHTVPHEAIAISHKHRLLAQELPESHACGNSLVAGLRCPHILQQLHHVRRREEVRAHATARVLEYRRDLVDVQAARVRADQRVRLRVLVQGQEHLFLQGHDLRHSLYDEVTILEVLEGQGRLDHPDVALCLRLRQSPPLHLPHPNAGDALHARVKPLLLRVLQHHLQALLHATDRDAAAHQTSAQDAHLLHGRRGRLQPRHLADHLLGEEQVAQSTRLHTEQQLRELAALDLCALLEAAGAACSADATDDRRRGDHPLRSVYRLRLRTVEPATVALEARRVGHRPLRDRRRRLGKRQLRRLLDDVALSHRVDDARLQRLLCLLRRAREEHRQSDLQGSHADDALGPLATRKQAELHLREAYRRFR